MDTHNPAKILGRRGGLARAKSLSAAQRKKIASLGGQIKALSAKAAQRIETNLMYSKVVQELGKIPKPKSISRVNHPLPKVYANPK